ncbi:unnamed protein product [Ixodes persulcatus]
MAANFAFIFKAAFLLVILLVVASGHYRGQRGRHGGGPGGERRRGDRCHYPRDCSRPIMGEEEDDDDRSVNTTAIFNNATRMCESTAQTSGPRDCAKFATLEFCQMVCGNVTQP